MSGDLGMGPYIIEFTEEKPSEEPPTEQIRELPEGGLIGQILAKKSNNNYDVEWINPATGDGGSIVGITINGKPLDGPITLTASDVGAIPTTRTINNKSLSNDITLTASDVGALPSTDTAVAATKLATGRTIKTNLGSTTAATFDGTSNITPGISGTLPVANGGTGQTTLTSGYALIGNGTSAVGLRAITNNTSTTAAIAGSSNLVTMNTLRYALNRTTGVNSSDTNYSTPMVRAIYAGTGSLTAGSSALISGVIYLKYK